MAAGARVESLDALRSFRAALVKFAEQVTAALGDVDAELQRTVTWLETEQLAYWRGQQQHRTQLVARAKEAVRAKTLFKGIGGRTLSAVDEEKALAIAVRRLEEAEQKIVAVKKWTPRLKKEILTYHGAVQRLANNVQLDIPLAVGQLSNMIGSLEDYLALQAPSAADAMAGVSTARGDASQLAASPASAQDEAASAGVQGKASADAAEIARQAEKTQPGKRTDP